MLISCFDTLREDMRAFAAIVQDMQRCYVIEQILLLILLIHYADFSLSHAVDADLRHDDADMPPCHHFFFFH